MIRVLVVDDEKIVRITLQTIMKWEQHGFELIGTAGDGLQALDKVAKDKPDIIITDLKMPNLDGIELIQKLREQSYAGKFIVLSNYDDYEYVREAMKLGAADYLLKITLKPEELLTLLIKVSEQLSEERQLKEKNVSMQIRLNEAYFQQKNAFWKELLKNGDSGDLSAGVEATQYGLDLNTLRGRLIYLKIDHYEDASSNGKIKNKKLLDFSVANIIKETVSNKYRSDCVELGNGTYTVIIYEQDIGLSEDSWQILVRDLVGLLKLYLNLSVSSTLSERFEGIHALQEQYDHCLRTSRATFYSGAGSMLIASQVDLSQWPIASGLWSEAITSAVEEGDSERLSAYMADIAEQLHTMKIEPLKIKQYFLTLLADLEYRIMKWRAVTGTDDRSLLEPDIVILSDSRKGAITQAETAEQFIAITEQALQEILSDFQAIKRSSFRKEVNRVISIMHENREGRIRLDQLAKEVNLNVNYLCRVFKRDTGKSIVQYMNELKILQSMELLKLPDCRVKEVAASVGIDDPVYFNRLFRKTVGVSPSEYRKKFSAIP
jgi:two-component system response regulator YesN